MLITLFVILFLVSILLFSIQLGLFMDRRVQWLWLIAIGVGVYFAHTYSIHQSYSIIRQMLLQGNLIVDFIVIQLAEAGLGIFIGITMMRYFYGEQIKRSVLWLNYFPGVVVFIALFYLECMAYFSNPGWGFKEMAIVLAFAFPLLLWTLKKMMIWLVPELDIRYEIKFFLHLIQIVFATTLYILLFSLPIAHVAVETPIYPMFSVMALVLLITGIGYLWFRFRLEKKQS